MFVVATVISPTYASISNRFLVALVIASRLTRWIKKERKGRAAARLPSRLPHRVQCLREARCEGSSAKRVSEPGSPFRIHKTRRSCERYSYCGYALCEGHSYTSREDILDLQRENNFSWDASWEYKFGTIRSFEDYYAIYTSDWHENIISWQSVQLKNSLKSSLIIH